MGFTETPKRATSSMLNRITTIVLVLAFTVMPSRAGAVQDGVKPHTLQIQELQKRKVELVDKMIKCSGAGGQKKKVCSYGEVMKMVGTLIKYLHKRNAYERERYSTLVDYNRFL